MTETARAFPKVFAHAHWRLLNKLAAGIRAARPRQREPRPAAVGVPGQQPGTQAGQQSRRPHRARSSRTRVSASDCRHPIALGWRRLSKAAAVPSNRCDTIVRRAPYMPVAGRSPFTICTSSTLRQPSWRWLPLIIPSAKCGRAPARILMCHSYYDMARTTISPYYSSCS